MNLQPRQNVEKPIVAIFNTDPDLIHALTFVMEDEGYNTISAPIPDLVRNKRMKEGYSVAEVVGNLRPQVYIVDIGPMHEKEVLEFVNEDLLSSGLTGDAKVIYTSTNYNHLQEIVPGFRAISIEQKPNPGMLSKPFELQELMGEVRKGIEDVTHARMQREVAQGVIGNKKSGEK